MITSSTSSGAYQIGETESTNTTIIRGFTIYDPQPVEVQISTPKKPRVLHLERARLKEQLKVWGLRKR